MDGVFLKKIFKRIVFLCALVFSFHMGATLSNGGKMYDYNYAIAMLDRAFSDAISVSQAEAYVLEHLPRLEDAACNALAGLEAEHISELSEIYNFLIDSANKQNNLMDHLCFSEIWTIWENVFFGE